MDPGVAEVVETEQYEEDDQEEEVSHQFLPDASLQARYRSGSSIPRHRRRGLARRERLSLIV